METKLTRIAEAARMRPPEKFASLVHLINEETIIGCHREMLKNKAAGIDEVAKEEYELNLESNEVIAFEFDTIRDKVVA
ncbi:MAG: hypothetical protein APF77_20465 [Clostridia bacterium BRH_c25]|nr:MAG: hypothetical protein APF77_20465 [Clostridia bacterium BRH_c25]